MLEDLINVRVSPTPCSSDRGACQMVIHAFPLLTRNITKKKIRKMADISLLFDKEEKFEDNFKVASEWKERILRQADAAALEIFEQGGVDAGGGSI